MKYIIKLNLFATLYAFVLCVQYLLMINGYRLDRIHWLSFRATTIFDLVFLVVSTIAIFLITTRYLNRGKLRYLLVILWIPYYIIFAKLSMKLMPITYPGDKPNPATGLILIGIYFLYPIYIAIINFFSNIFVEEFRIGKKISK